MKLYDMPEDWYRASRVCRILGNPKTYAIVKILLKEGMLTPSELSKKLNRKVATISEHLKNLRNLDIVRYQRKGNEAIYWIKDERIKNIIISLESFIKRTRKKKY